MRRRIPYRISETECELLYCRCSQLWRALGYPEYDWWDDRVEYLTSMANSKNTVDHASFSLKDM